MTKSTMKKDLHDTRISLRSQLKEISKSLDNLANLDTLKKLQDEVTILGENLKKEQILELERQVEVLSK